MEARLWPNFFTLLWFELRSPQIEQRLFPLHILPSGTMQKTLLKLLPQRLFPAEVLVPLNIYSTIKLCLLFQLSTMHPSSLHHKQKGGVGSKTHEGCLTHPITRLLAVA